MAIIIENSLDHNLHWQLLRLISKTQATIKSVLPRHGLYVSSKSQCFPTSSLEERFLVLEESVEKDVLLIKFKSRFY